MAVLSAGDSGSGLFLTKYRIDGGPWIAYNRPIAIGGSGTRTFEAYSIDNIGNIEQTRLYAYVVDVLRPVADAGRDLAVFAPVDITLDGLGSTDDTLIVEYEWILESDGSVVLTTAKGTVGIQSPGVYIFSLKVRDPLGRESTDSITINVLRDPDSDKDTLPDVWEMEKFGNLTYGPGDDPDGDGITNIKEYGREGDGGDVQSGLDALPQSEGDRTGEVLMLLLMVVLGVLAGVAMLQFLKIRELRRRLDDREAEASIEFEEDYGGESR